MHKIFKKIAKIMTLLNFNKQKRQYRRFMLTRTLKSKYYGEQIFRTAKSIGIDFYCGGKSKVNKNTVIKDYVCFNGMTIAGSGNVTIGSYFHSGVECMIIAQNHKYNDGEFIPYGTEYTYKDIIIDDFVWLGSRVTILPGTHIGEGAIIQAGAVVHGEIPPCAIAGGNPAKVFKYRDIEHFNKLKEEKKFLTAKSYYEEKFGYKENE